MGRNDEEGEGSPSVPAGTECCMCGDYGLSSELFRCKDCRFRSQHKYCSDLYPDAKSYHICNWCLSRGQKENGTKLKSLKHNSISQRKTTSSDDDQMKKMIKKSKRDNNMIDHGDVNKGILKRTVSCGQIKKTDGESTAAGMKRVTIDDGGIIIKKRTTKSDDNSIIKQVVRNKVRRYKLLEEVSS